MQLIDDCHGARPGPSLGAVRGAIDRTLAFFRRTICQGRVSESQGDEPERYDPDTQLWPPIRDPASRTAVELRPGEGAFWIGELEADTTLESDYILFLSFLDRDAHAEKIRKLANYIRAQQLEEGSWNIFHGGPGEISASVKAYFALKLAGYSVDEPFMVRAREAIISMGGADRVNSYTKIYLSFLNQYDWTEIPAIPPEIILLPRFFYFNVYEISYWSRAILIPLSILYAKKPNRNTGLELSIDELFHRDQGLNGDSQEDGNGESGGAKQRKLAIDPNLLSWRSFFTLVDRILRMLEKSPVKPLRGLALKKAEKWVVARSEDSDGLGAIFPSMVNSVMAMHCLGHDENHPTVATNLKKLQELEIEDGECIRLQPCLSPVWDTALILNAMGEAGCPADAPEIVEGTRWLLSKEVRKPGDWNKRVRGVEVSGWPFQFRNEFYPDIDDTAAVLLALDRCDPQSIDGLDRVIQRGVRWILSLQCSGGGWAAFDVDIDHEVFNHVPYADHNAMLDPACPDITGRVLEALGRFDEFEGDADVRRAIDAGVQYLKNAQEADGSWYGRWGVNYIYGTWQAIKGLVSVGEDPKAPYMRKAVEWLRSVQNEDGGWGETCDSYPHPEMKGQGPSTASQTAWAVMALTAAGDAYDSATERGVEFLLERQLPDGTWDEKDYTGTGFPDVFYLRYHFYRVTFPLFALGYYKRVVEGEPPSRASAREQRDLTGDGVVPSRP